jgi:hypothetical protein
MFITLVARKGKGCQICKKIGRALQGTNDFLHVVFIFSSIPGNHDLEGHIHIFLNVTSQPNSGVEAMAEFMIYAVCPIEHIPNADRIVWVWVLTKVYITFGTFLELIIVLVVRVHCVAVITVLQRHDLDPRYSLPGVSKRYGLAIISSRYGTLSFLRRYGLATALKRYGLAGVLRRYGRDMTLPVFWDMTLPLSRRDMTFALSRRGIYRKSDGFERKETVLLLSG